MHHSDDSYEYKNLGKRVGRRARTSQGGNGQIVRRFVRGARFEPNAIDADNDGVVQENTQFARRATRRNMPPARRVNMRPGRDNLQTARRIAPQQSTPQSAAQGVNPAAFAKKYGDQIYKIVNVNAKPIKPEKAKKVLDHYDKEVTSKFGQINTVGEAVQALQKAAPNIVQTFDFLDITDPDIELTFSQRGTVRGYLYALSKFDLKKFDITFREANPNDPDDTPSTEVRFTDEYGKLLARPTITFTYTDLPAANNGKDFVVNRWLNDLQAGRSTSTMGTVHSGIMLAYEENPWKGDFGDPNFTTEENMSQMERFFEAIHESMHALNFNKMDEQVFGNLTQAERQKLINDTVQQQQARLFEPRILHIGLQALEELWNRETFIQQKKTLRANILRLGKTADERNTLLTIATQGRMNDLAELDKVIKDKIDQSGNLLYEFGPGRPYEKYAQLAKDYKAAARSGKYSLADFAKRTNRQQLIQLGKDVIANEGLPVNAPRRFPAKPGQNFKDNQTLNDVEAKILGARIGQMMRNWTNQEIDAWYQKAFADLRLPKSPQSETALVRQVTIELQGTNSSDPMYGKALKTLIPFLQNELGIPQTGNLDKNTWDRIFSNQIDHKDVNDIINNYWMTDPGTTNYLATTGLTHRHMLDQLTDDEKKAAIRWMTKYSDYGSQKEYSFYDNTTLNQMVELPAELYTALLIAKDANTPIPPAIRKLFTWHFSDTEYESMIKP